jgi:two-component system, chemotaxis family, protein-glutamate methylesterase/glutaminase
MSAPIRVVVVEDSMTVRRRLCDTLAADPGFTVVGEAGDGRRAIELCRDQRPDVVTMDMMLPVMSGLAATEYIMAHHATPILIVSSSTNRGELFKTYEALAAGAVDVLEKPRGDEPEGDWERRFLAAVRLVSRIRVITHPRARLRSLTPSSSPLIVPPPLPLGPSPRRRLIAIGASTGGPGAVVDVLRELPPELDLPVLLVLHIGDPFGSSFADWLDSQTPRRVVLARDGELLSAAAGKVLLAPPGRHLAIRDGRVALSTGPERHSCRPSVDVLFEAVARESGDASIAALLTGMGRDGAAGLLQIRQAGGATIAQDEATSVVYGMPREAVLLGAAERVLPLRQIGGAIAHIARSGDPDAR